MKKTLILLSILTSFVASAQSIEINPNGGTNASAVLDLKSTTKGFLLPRMTNAQMRAIPSPAQGLLAFCTDCGTNGDYYFYKGTAWVALGSVTVSVSTTVGSVSANADEKGATITNGVLNLAPANATKPGIITATDQTFGGAKTFSADLTVNGLTVGKGPGGVISLNTVIGMSALNKNTTGGNNTAIGRDALQANTTGNNNTANGNDALSSNTNGSENIANGSFALRVNTTGMGNTASGYEALNSNTTGNSNTANGGNALFQNITGKENTANGTYALSSNTTGSNNTAIGYFADVASGALTNATAIGNGASVNASHKIQLGNGEVTAVQLGTDKVILETSRVKITGGTPGDGKILTSDANGLASWATASSIGVDLTTAQTIAGVKTFTADLTVNGLTVGKGRNGISTNTAVGLNALSSNTTGGANTANGYGALKSNTEGSGNIAIGQNVYIPAKLSHRL